MLPLVRALVAPRVLLLHALGAAATTAALLLGLWQLEAWQAGREAEARDLAGERPLPLTSVLDADDPFPNTDVGRPVTLAGSWLPESSMLVADRDLGDRRGVWAVTPVAVCRSAGDAACDPDRDPAILVVRGWAPSATDVPVAPEGEVSLSGWLQPGEGRGIPDPDPGDRVIPELRIASAIQLVDRDLYGGYVVANDGVDPGELTPVTPDSLPSPSTFTSLQNLLYAVEWWLFGAFAVFLWQRWVRDDLERQRRRRDDQASGAGHPPGPTGEDAPGAEIASTP